MSLSLPFDSSNWRKPSFTTPLNERVDLAQAALELSVANLTSDGQFQAPQFYFQSGLLYSQMAEFDLVSNQSRYKDKLSLFLEAREREREGTNPFLRDGLVYGFAAARSYLAYKDPKYLSYAVNWWSWAQKWTISEANVASGTFEGKDFTLQTECDGKSIVGGAFDSTANNRKNGVVSVMSTGHFLTLSSLLREATQNQTYLDHATSSYNFIRTHLIPASGYLPQHSVPLDSADRTKCTTAGSIDSGNAGVWIEGLASYESVSAGEAGTVGDLVEKTFASAVANGEWNTNERVLRYNPGSLLPNLNLPRGLTTLYQRNTTSVLRTEIEKYLAVQFNAILDQATVTGSNVYREEWTGSAPTSQLDFDVDGQISAQQVLISSISLSYTPSTPAPINPETGDDPSGSGSSGSSISGGVIGGAIGGILALVALIGVLFFCLRRRRRRQAEVREVNHALVDQPYPVSALHAESGTGTGGEETLTPLRRNNQDFPLTAPVGYSDQEKAPLPSPSSPSNTLSNSEALSASGRTLSTSDGRATHLQEDIQELQTNMQHILNVLNQRSNTDLRHLEGGGMDNYPPPPEYPGARE
ncbi:hypothetical protein PM082_014890 [Marasmius tenuissimus]|nr:hypothetical protein PM082_014890 [Marasmius tenuissimus]